MGLGGSIGETGLQWILDEEEDGPIFMNWN